MRNNQLVVMVFPHLKYLQNKARECKSNEWHRVKKNFYIYKLLKTPQTACIKCNIAQ